MERGSAFQVEDSVLATKFQVNVRNNVVFLEWRNERRWARWEVSSGEPWTDSKQWPSEGGSSGGEGVSPGGEDGLSGREDGLSPQL